MDDISKIMAELDKTYPNWEQHECRASDVDEVFTRINEGRPESIKDILQYRRRDFIHHVLHAALAAGVVKLPNE